MCGSEIVFTFDEGGFGFVDGHDGFVGVGGRRRRGGVSGRDQRNMPKSGRSN